MGLSDEIGVPELEGEVKSDATGPSGAEQRSCKVGDVGVRVVSLCTTISCEDVDWGLLKTSVGVARGGTSGEGRRYSGSRGEGGKSNGIEGIGAEESPGWAGC